MGAFCILQKIFQRNFRFRPAFKKVVCIIPRKGEVLPPFGRKEVITWNLIAENFRSNVSFKVSVNGCYTTKPVTPMMKSGDAGNGKFLFEERQLYTTDKYFQAETAEPTYQMAGKEITPKLLLEAIRTLPEEKRTAILLYYFEGMTDVEIGKMFNTSRSTIQYRRTSSFELLKKYLEEHADEWNEW